jgi:putative transposase
MPRSVRLEFPGAFYHIMARGNRKEAIFLDEDDHRFFLKTLAEACGRTGWRVHAWVLMGNHYHLLVETPEPNLVAGMQWLQNTYTRRFNVRHQVWGRLFGDRYKAALVDREGDYYQRLLDYIHLNPARAGKIQPAQNMSILDYPWSSVAGGYALPPNQRASWLAAVDGLSSFGLADTTSGRKQFVDRLDRRVVAEGLQHAGIPMDDRAVDARCSNLQRGWYWGSQEFGQKMLRLAENLLQKERDRSYRASEESRQHTEQKAELLLQTGLAAAGLSQAKLAALPGSDPRKVAVAAAIHQQTSMRLPWITERLFMKTPANASQQISRWRKGKTPTNTLPAKLQEWVRQSRIDD